MRPLLTRMARTCRKPMNYLASRSLQTKNLPGGRVLSSPRHKQFDTDLQAESVLVETRRIELPTFALRTRRSPS
jgi:hypothetical protein